MSNVIAFDPQPQVSAGCALTRLIATFAQDRRAPDDVFWLKENAEVLNILEATDARPDPDALNPHAEFYAGLEERLHFYPQYYRFLLSICLDLEDLGMPGDIGARLCRWAADQGLAQAELSDLQRAEARRLLARRGAALALANDPLAARLRGFIGRSTTFAMPNKKAAYELTHIVFYLAEYGRRDPQLDRAALTSLEYAGLLAYLDQNLDLLAEVCTALHFAGQRPSPIWLEAVARCHAGMAVVGDPAAPLQDAYHTYLETGWTRAVVGTPAFQAVPDEGGLRFRPARGTMGALLPLSECLFDLGPERSTDWEKMRGQVMPYLGADGHEVLYKAERSTDKFDVFFEGFARAAAR
ncbi:MAG: hypothetical protein HKN30_02530 [Sulfitobacter sp.]|nr:hypothetical protein [Sulfitobacter sp.]